MKLSPDQGRSVDAVPTVLQVTLQSIVEQTVAGR